MPEGILSVSPFEADQHDLQAILADCHGPIQPVRTMEDTLCRLAYGAVPLIVCERDLPDGNWKLLFQQTETLPRPPRFLVSSRLADDYLWVEVLTVGGYDLLRTPFLAREVLHAVESAWNSWQRQWVPATRRGARHEARPGAVEHSLERSSRGFGSGAV
jgi:hypothetical protein